MAVFIVIHSVIRLLSLETNKTKQFKEGINKYTNTELAHIVHVHGIGTRTCILVILGPAVYHTYECCWSTADGEDAEPTATEWAGTVRGTAH